MPARGSGSPPSCSTRRPDSTSGRTANTTLDDAFDTGDEIAQAISVALRPELLKDMSERAMRQAPADLTAWDYALRGVWHLRRTNTRRRRAVGRAAHPRRPARPCLRRSRTQTSRTRTTDAPAALDRRPRRGPCGARRARGSRGRLRPDGGERLRLPVPRVLRPGQAPGRGGHASAGGQAESEASLSRARSSASSWASRGARRKVCGSSTPRSGSPARPTSLDVLRRQGGRALGRGQARGVTLRASGRSSWTPTPRLRRPSRTSRRTRPCSATCREREPLSPRPCGCGRTCPRQRCARSSPRFPSLGSRSTSTGYGSLAGRRTPQEYPRRRLKEHAMSTFPRSTTRCRIRRCARS